MGKGVGVCSWKIKIDSKGNDILTNYDIQQKDHYKWKLNWRDDDNKYKAS